MTFYHFVALFPFVPVVAAVSGKGKAPLRKRCNASRVKLFLSEESSCEKGCQVTSEQIKADMKAASDVTAERNKSKDCYPGCGGGTGPPGASDTAASPSPDGMKTTDSCSEAPSAATEDSGKCLCKSESSSERDSEEKPLCSRCSCYMPQNQQRRTNGVSGGECPSTSGACGMNGPNVRGAEFSLRTLPNCGSSGEASNGRTNERVCGTANEERSPPSQQGRYEMEYNEDYPRRPLTRARSRLSHVPLVSQSGMVSFIQVLHQSSALLSKKGEDQPHCRNVRAEMQFSLCSCVGLFWVLIIEHSLFERGFFCGGRIP